MAFLPNKLRTLLYTLLLFSSSSDLVLAFVQRGVPSHRQCAAPSRSRGDGIVDFHSKRPVMSLLRIRGGASSTSKLRAANLDVGNGGDEKTDKLARAALVSIRSCVRMCFLAVLSDVIVTFVDDDIASKFFGRGTWSWTDYADMFDSLSLVFFGGGLWRISNLYFESMSNTNQRMGHESLLDLFRTMGWIWGIIAVNLALVSVTAAASLRSHIAADGPLRFLFEGVSSKQLCVSVMIVLGAGAAAVLGRCRQTANEEVKAYRETNGIIQEERLKSRDLAGEKSNMVRDAGYRAYVNQALCAGSFGVAAVLELIKWVVSLDAASAIGHVFSISEFVTPFAISALLLTLNKALLRAAIAEIIGDTNKAGEDASVYSDLFVAQKGFYDKAAETLKTASIFRLLPYLIAPLMPQMLNALEKTAKLLGKVSPSLSARALELLSGST